MDKMKAVICTKYGTPEVLKIVEIEKPTPKDNEVLIKIVASAVNSGDVRVRGLVVTGFLKVVMRFVLGFNKPRKPILGTVFSGVIEQTGKNVKGFVNGVEVFGLTGFKFGAHAEYITLSGKSVIAKKPVNATFEEAAAILFGGQTAVYFLEEKAKISEKENPKILIYGATGSVGTAAIQIAKFYNTQITVVCSEAGENLVKELGVDDIVFYEKEDFTKRTEKFDIIFDAVGKTSKKQCAPLLNDKGYYGTVGGLEVAAERIEQLEFLRKLFENGKYKATIDRVYSIDEIVDAYRYVDTSRKKGNVVLKIAE
jgi:NADPH:quinone reductase-like Zn-dependent oxidoreductase